MYTQAKGMLNVGSINGNIREVEERLEAAKADFEANSEVEFIGVCNSTIAFEGCNDSIFMFFGAEIKNYDREIQTWIEYLLKWFPSAEGKFDIQYEEDYTPETLFVHKGKIVKREDCKVEQKGYGNYFK